MKKARSYINGIHKFQLSLSSLIMGAAIITMTGCATTPSPAEKQAEANQADPYEGMNRDVSGFNDTVDGYVAKPIAEAYQFVTPQFVQTGVSNFFGNLKNINVVINDVLQAKFEQGLEDSGRFAMNTTVGLGGLFDVAKHVGLEQNEEDFEQTLAVWGVPSGPYLVLPILGPTTVRGIPGAIFDGATNPVNYVGAPVQLLQMLNARANAEGALKFIDEASLDPYVFTRESFLQWRNSLASDGKVVASADDFDADFAGDVSSTPANAKSSKNDVKDAKKGGHEANTLPTLSLSAEDNSEESKYSFNDVTKTFQGTAQSFVDARTKLDQLKKKKKFVSKKI